MRVSRLSIKSQPPPPSGTPNAKPAYAVLCTPDKSFQLRQVQTSNSLFVTSPALEAHGNAIPAPTTRAIASCATTLELQPAVESAVSYLEAALPLYHMVEGEVDADQNHSTKAGVFADIPLSDGQCQNAWDELTAFELDGNSYRPSADVVSRVWQSINAAALAEGIKLEKQFLKNDVAKLVEEDGYKAPLCLAVLGHLTSADSALADDWSCLDRTRSVTFIGKKLLEARGELSDYLTADFLEAWRDCLPESWRADAELIAIDGAYTLPTSTTICAKGKAMANPTATPAPTKGKGNWHEKFGKTRKK